MSINEDCWVFAYGSLMWHADFPHAEARPAKLYGYHRALCLWSFDYRGTREKPGLVLGLAHTGRVEHPTQCSQAWKRSWACVWFWASVRSWFVAHVCIWGLRDTMHIGCSWKLGMG